MRDEMAASFIRPRLLMGRSDASRELRRYMHALQCPVLVEVRAVEVQACPRSRRRSPSSTTRHLRHSFVGPVVDQDSSSLPPPAVAPFSRPLSPSLLSSDDDELWTLPSSSSSSTSSRQKQGPVVYPTTSYR